MTRCQACGRRLISPESQRMGFGPVCVERQRSRGLMVGGRPRPSLRQMTSSGRRRKPDPGQIPLEGM